MKRIQVPEQKRRPVSLRWWEQQDEQVLSLCWHGGPSTPGTRAIVRANELLRREKR